MMRSLTNNALGGKARAVATVEPLDPAPRLLVISSFSLLDRSASGQMLRGLLADWPSTELAFLQLGATGASTPSPVNTWVEPGTFGRVATAVRRLRKKGNFVASRSAIPPGNGRLRSSLLAWLELIPFCVDSEMAQWIQTFQPQMIYTWLGTPAIHRVVRQVAARWQVPTAVHVMDDWVNCKHRGNWLAAPSRWVLVSGFEREVAAAAVCIAIGEQMAAAYRSRYARTFEVISNAIDLSRFPPPSPRADAGAMGSRLVLGHVGRVTGGRLQGLRTIEKVLRILAGRGVATRLQLLGVSAADLPAALRDSPVVQWDPDSSDERVRRLGGEADGLLQVESFDPRENDWFRLSLSAKLPLYLALGRPVIAYGPRGLGSVDYIAADHCGVVITQEGPTPLLGALQQFLEAPSEREMMGLRARQLAESRHNRTNVCARFREILMRAAKS